MSAVDRQARRWTPAEDQTLRELVEAQAGEGEGRDWCQIALALPRRTNKDCRKRWHNSLAEGLKKGQWSKSEDQMLTNGVHHADQCAKRWQQSLDPRLDRSEWRKDEDAALLRAVEHLGRHWKDIQQQYLPHRSKNCVKNRYSVLARCTAPQNVSYDDSLGSSPSEPGTPLQMQAESPMFPMLVPHMHHHQHSSLMQEPIMDTSGNDLSWDWLEVTSNMSTSTQPYPYLHGTSWHGNNSTYDHHNISSNIGQWSDTQTSVNPQCLLQHVNHTSVAMQHYMVSSCQYPETTSGTMCTPLPSPSFDPSTATSRLPTSPMYRVPHTYQHRDTAPFG